MSPAEIDIMETLTRARERRTAFCDAAASSCHESGKMRLWSTKATQKLMSGRASASHRINDWASSSARSSSSPSETKKGGSSSADGSARREPKRRLGGYRYIGGHMPDEAVAAGSSIGDSTPTATLGLSRRTSSIIERVLGTCSWMAGGDALNGCLAFYRLVRRGLVTHPLAGRRHPRTSAASSMSRRQTPAFSEEMMLPNSASRCSSATYKRAHAACIGAANLSRVHQTKDTVRHRPESY